MFRDVMVEAITCPFFGPEACSLFKDGLKRNIYEHLMLDASTRNENTSLKNVVRATKEAKAMLRLSAGHSGDSAPRPHRAQGTDSRPPERTRVDRPRVELHGGDEARSRRNALQAGEAYLQLLWQPKQRSQERYSCCGWRHQASNARRCFEFV